MYKRASIPSNIIFILLFIIFAVVSAAVVFSVGVPGLGSSSEVVEDFSASVKDKTAYFNIDDVREKFNDDVIRVDLSENGIISIENLEFGYFVESAGNAKCKGQLHGASIDCATIDEIFSGLCYVGCNNCNGNASGVFWGSDQFTWTDPYDPTNTFSFFETINVCNDSAVLSENCTEVCKLFISTMAEEPWTPVCGDGVCNGSETDISCPADCAQNCSGGKSHGDVWCTDCYMGAYYYCNNISLCNNSVILDFNCGAFCYSLGYAGPDYFGAACLWTVSPPYCYVNYKTASMPVSVLVYCGVPP